MHSWDEQTVTCCVGRPLSLNVILNHSENTSLRSQFSESVKYSKTKLCNDSVTSYFSALCETAGRMFTWQALITQTNLDPLHLSCTLKLFCPSCVCMNVCVYTMYTWFPECLFVCLGWVCICVCKYRVLCVDVCLSQWVGVVVWVGLSFQIGSRWQSGVFVVVWGPTRLQPSCVSLPHSAATLCLRLRPVFNLEHRLKR